MFTRRPPYAAAIISESNGDRRPRAATRRRKAPSRSAGGSARNSRPPDRAAGYQPEWGLGGHQDPAPRLGPIWLRLNDPCQPDWVEAKVVAITTRFWGPALVRMKFRESCPYEFFKAAIRGIGPSADRPTKPAEATPAATTGAASTGTEALASPELTRPSLADGRRRHMPGQCCLTNFCARLPMMSPA